MSRQQRGGSIREWVAKAHAFMRKNKGYSRGSQMLLNKFGNRISNPHIRGLAQSGINALSQAGYGRYCSKYQPRKCVSMYIGKDPKQNYRCAQYTTRTCVKKRVPKKRVRFTV